MSEDPKPTAIIKPIRLGRGLSDLIGEVDAVGPVAEAAAVKAPAIASNEIPVDLIRRNPAQPRRHFDETALKELAESIRTKGILQAILVRPDPKETGKFQIIAGERRWRAAKLAGLTSVPAMVRNLDELELLEAGIIENVQRMDLNPIEEAEAYEALMKRFGRTQEGLASSIGKSRVHIANTLRLLQFGDESRALLREGKVSAGHARAALGAPDPDDLLYQASAKNLSVREVEALARIARDAVPYETKSAKPVKLVEKSVDTEALEADLSRALGLDVDIRHGEKGGELRIRYRSLDQLDDVIARLNSRRKV